MTDLVLTEDRDGVRTVRMNRPDKKNALTLAMYTAMAEALESGAADDRVRVFVIAGSGSDFTSGNDLNDFLTLSSVVGSPVDRFVAALAGTPKPVVAAVRGAAVGIGTTMLMHCDIVHAAPETRFALPFINLALVPEAASTMILPGLAGHRRAAELLMLGEPFDAGTAREIGLINKVVPAAEVEESVQAVAARLAAKPAQALRWTKELLKAEAEPVAARVAREFKLFDACLASPDLREAVTAFREKRAPNFAK